MTARILIAMCLGVLAGSFLGDFALSLGVVGNLVIHSIKVIATPLVFLVVMRAIATTDVGGKSFLRVGAVALFNVTIAITIGLTLSNLVRPGERLKVLGGEATRAYQEQRFDWQTTLESFIPKSVVAPFAENAILPVVILALLAGFALRIASRETGEVQESAQSIHKFLAGCYRLTEIILGWVLQLIPFAVFAVVAKTIAQHGFTHLQGLLVYVLVGVGGLTLHALITYQLWIALYAKIPLRRFWREAKEPVVVALGSNSSLATLPVTLRALDRLGVSRSSSAMGAAVATNLNNDGIVLYEAMTALLVAQAAGIHLSIPQQIFVALFSMIAAMGIAGVPEAGFISLALVLNAMALPLEMLPILLTVDWLIARGRSAVNVLSDMVLSIVLDRSLLTTKVPPVPIKTA